MCGPYRVKSIKKEQKALSVVQNSGTFGIEA